MENILFRTKGNANPRGKPRVYFTCHPDDFEKYFETVCDDILKAQDCAIYYTADMTAAADPTDLFSTLEQCNLFVIPVTYALLQSPNRAMEQDLPFARKKHIPVLPIMMEDGLDPLFALPDKFGDMQYVDPRSKDATQIAYKDKLEKFLEAVLIGKETAERIQAAFSAYIFLSYRKKDRYYANRLMRLIHQNPAYRDIAIWFDEFLTPGEDFRENIHAMLSKSKLFALVVTPHILEMLDGKPNYVMGVEYRDARSAGLHIFPAEMVSTDKAELQEKFEELPECVDVHDPELFSQCLSETVSKLSITYQNDDPEHTYLIGLAYLEGIDVETDRDRGLTLIIAAAEKELPEAIKRLISMYYYGTGVALDYKEAERWAKRLVSYCVKTYGQTHEETRKSMERLGILYQTTGKYQDALDIRQDIYNICKEGLGEDHPDTMLAMLPLANSYDDMGEFDQALRYYECYHAYLTQRYGDRHETTMQVLNNMASVNISLSNYALACRQLEQVLEVYRDKFGDTDPSTLSTMSNLAGAYGLHGETDREWALARQAYEVIAKDHDIHHPQFFPIVNTMAASYFHRKEYENAVSLTKQLYDDICAVHDENHPYAISALNNLGTYYAYAGENPKGLELRERAYKRQKSLLGQTHPDTLQFQDNLAVAYFKAGHTQEALKLALEADALCMEKFEKTHDLAISLANNLTAIYLDSEEYQKALPYAQRRYDALREKHGDLHGQTRNALSTLIRIYRGLSNPAKVLLLQERLYEQESRCLKKEDPDFLITLNNLAMAYHLNGNFQKAKDYMEQAYPLYRNGYGEDHTETLAVMRSLSMLYCACGEFAKGMAINQKIDLLTKQKKQANASKKEQTKKKKGRK